MMYSDTSLQRDDVQQHVAATRWRTATRRCNVMTMYSDMSLEHDDDVQRHVAAT